MSATVKSRKKRKKHKESILQSKDGTCYLCALLNGDYSKKIVQEHHIFGGPNRTISEAEGFKAYLCIGHHTNGPAAVHNNKENMMILKQEGQRAYEQNHTHEEFMELIGKNYLDETPAAVENTSPDIIFFNNEDENEEKKL